MLLLPKEIILSLNLIRCIKIQRFVIIIRYLVGYSKIYNVYFVCCYRSSTLYCTNYVCITWISTRPTPMYLLYESAKRDVKHTCTCIQHCCTQMYIHQFTDSHTSEQNVMFTDYTSVQTLLPYKNVWCHIYRLKSRPTASSVLLGWYRSADGVWEPYTDIRWIRMVPFDITQSHNIDEDNRISQNHLNLNKYHNVILLSECNIVLDLLLKENSMRLVFRTGHSLHNYYIYSRSLLTLSSRGLTLDVRIWRFYASESVAAALKKYIIHNGMDR